MAILGAIGGFGAVRLARTPTRFVDGVELRIMQPNLQQDVKFNYAARQKVMDRYIALSERASRRNRPARKSSNSDLAGIGFSVFPRARARRAGPNHAAVAPSTVLITGAVRLGRTGQSRRVRRVYNSIYVIDHDGSIVSIYDKMHLVPFGEYLPLQTFSRKPRPAAADQAAGRLLRRRPAPADLLCRALRRRCR